MIITIIMIISGVPASTPPWPLILQLRAMSVGVMSMNLRRIPLRQLGMGLASGTWKGLQRHT